MSRHRRLLIALCTAACLAVTVTSAAAGRYHPRLRFRALRTPHFTIYYHQGESRLATRLAAIAEDVREDLSRRTTLDAPAHVHVVLVDQSDVANGWSTPVPFDLIEIEAVPPAPSSFLGHEDDWLRTVFAHEYAHVLHLDRVGGWMRPVRWLLGRHPATFPNLYVPEWQVEGFATWAESAVTGLGRIHAADVAAVTTLAAAGHRMTIDRAGGGLVAWPSGHASYFFGGALYEHLDGRESAAALGDLTRETARRLPFLGGRAFRTVFGTTAGKLWNEEFAPQAGAPRAGDASITRLTREGYVVSGPRFVRPPSASAIPVDTVCFSTQSPHHFPDIRRVTLAGGASSSVVSRYDGDTLSADGRWVFFDQLEYDSAVALVADLYAFDLQTGDTHRLSHGQRLTDPDVDKTGERVAAIKASDGRKRLVIWRILRGADGRPRLAPTPQRTAGNPACEYATPRWSPDATRIVAARQCAGSLPSIVVINADDGTERLVTSEPAARNITPTWSPDGRTILFASDRQDHRFKLFGLPGAASTPTGPPAAPALLVDPPGAAMWPDVSPDGRTVVFTGLTPEGFDIFSAPLPVPTEEPFHSSAPTDSSTSAPGAGPADPSAGDRQTADAATADPRYSPWRTLLPRAWLPFFTMSGDRVDLGASVGASDALGYHEYQIAALWRASGATADYAFARPAVEWSAWYSYNRWQPSLFVAASDTLDTVTVGVAGSEVTRTSDERTREVLGGVILPWRRVRLAQSWFAGLDLEKRRLPSDTGIPDRWRNALRAGWNLTSSREFGYSISPERGVSALVNIERVSPGLGADGRATSFTADGRAYLPAFGLHDVVAFRAAAGSSTGDRAVTRQFSLGEPGLSSGAFNLGRRSVGLLRGLGPDARVNSAVAVANVDYRFPLVRVERGIGTLPLFVRDIHGAVFADVGATGFTLGALPKPAWSIGTEIASRLVLGYSWGLNVAAGVAWTHDPTRAGRPTRAAGFVRTGYAF